MPPPLHLLPNSPPATPPQGLACDLLEKLALLGWLEVFLILSHGIS